MFSFWPFDKGVSIESSGFLAGYEDAHSHILPGVDDGVSDAEESLSILALYESMGVRRVWLTPHIMEDVPNSPSDLRARFDAFCKLYEGGIELRLSSENMLDSLFEERFASNDILPYGEDGDSLLVETSYFTPPYGFYSMLEEIKHRGYYPVLAHPERYIYMDKDVYRKLKSMGVQFQLNLPSLAGYYGPEVRRKAIWLVNNGLCNMYGCDVHSLSSLRHIVSSRIPHRTVEALMMNR